MEYIRTHQKTESLQIQQNNDRQRVPNEDARNTNGPQRQARQNQLAKCPNSTLCSKEKLAWVHTSEIYRVLELVCSSRRMFPFHRGKAFVDSQCRTGKKHGGFPETNGFSSCQKHPPLQNLPLRVRQVASGSGSSQPSRRRPGGSTLGKPQKPGIARAQESRGRSQKLRVGSSCSPL